MTLSSRSTRASKPEVSGVQPMDAAETRKRIADERLAKFFLSTRESFAARDIGEALGWDPSKTRSAIRRAVRKGTPHPYLCWGEKRAQRFGLAEAGRFIRENSECGSAGLVELLMVPHPSKDSLNLPYVLLWQMLMAAHRGEWKPSPDFMLFRYPVPQGSPLDDV